MVRLKQMLPFLFVNALLFYLVPWVIQDTGSGMWILLIILPVGCLVVAWQYGARYSFNLMFSILTVLLFIPTIYIYYNSSAMIYALIYGLISIVGNLLGAKLSYRP